LVLLRRALARIEEIPASQESDRITALRATATLRMGASDPWIQARNSHDDVAIEQIEAGLMGVENEIVAAAWWAHGRAWAQTVVGFHSPSTIHLPGRVADAPAAFFEGLGHGMGEEWGPADTIPYPINLPAQGEEALREGYRVGVGRRWLGGDNQALPQLRRQ
jgi:hypothetical protein